jgi:SAM-dependent methyltransferase
MLLSIAIESYDMLSLTTGGTGSMPNAAVQRRRWGSRVQTWHQHVTASPAFEEIRRAVLREAAAGPADCAVDLGAGTGFLTLPLAATVARVVAVDIAQPMLEQLSAAARRDGHGNLRTLCADLCSVDLAPASVDLVVSSYALHHLPDADKSALLERARGWLRPGGRVVIADMMFGRGGSRRDRAILWAKVRRLARKGPGGLWRIVKNAARFGLRLGTERPAPPEFWIAALRRAGFADVRFVPIVREAGLVSATVPAASAFQPPPA